MAAIHLNTSGIDSTGNIMPESITRGTSSTIAESSNAISCVVAMFEINSPKDNASMMYIVETTYIHAILPAKGTSST